MLQDVHIGLSGDHGNGICTGTSIVNKHSGRNRVRRPLEW